MALEQPLLLAECGVVLLHKFISVGTVRVPLIVFLELAEVCMFTLEPDAESDVSKKLEVSSVFRLLMGNDSVIKEVL